MKWILVLVLSIAGDLETTKVEFEDQNLCQRALKDVQAAPPSLGGNAWWVGNPKTVTGEPTAQDHEVLLRGAYCMETGY